MLSPAILPRCINNNSNYWPSNQSVAPAHWACLGEQIDRHLKSHIDCREGEKNTKGDGKIDRDSQREKEGERRRGGGVIRERCLQVRTISTA